MTSPNTELLALADWLRSEWDRHENSICSNDAEVVAFQNKLERWEKALRTAASHEAEIAACKAEIERLRKALRGAGR